jgi:hypothetical protein
MRRSVACLGLGALLWVLVGAVRGATYWQVSASSYLLSLLVAGAAFGLLWPAAHLRTGALLVFPGFVALVSAGAPGHPDVFWWMVTVGLGACGAAGSHWLGVEVRGHFAAPRRGR